MKVQQTEMQQKLTSFQTQCSLHSHYNFHRPGTMNWIHCPRCQCMLPCRDNCCLQSRKRLLLLSFVDSFVHRYMHCHWCSPCLRSTIEIRCSYYCQLYQSWMYRLHGTKSWVLLLVTAWKGYQGKLQSRQNSSLFHCYSWLTFLSKTRVITHHPTTL